jgi:HSP20 family protein
MSRRSWPQDPAAWRAALDELLREAGHAWAGSNMGQGMPLALYATDEQLVLLVAVPGMRPEELELTIHQDTVTLSGTVEALRHAEAVSGATWYLQELRQEPYQRSVRLPFPVDAERAEATLTDGLLRLALPKATQDRPRHIAIGRPQT